MTADSARKAVDAGADAIIVSNHGGRVLDQTPATAWVLPEIAKAVGKDGMIGGQVIDMENEERNDVEKTIPGLVPYEELPESEKEYDRNTSRETLKLILKLGFGIGKSLL